MAACRSTAARLLGVAPNASTRHIQAAFRKKALETHPDRKGGSATQFLAARDAADLLLRPAPAATAPPRAPQPSHTTDASAVAHRTIRSLDEELAAVKMSADVDKVMPRLLRALGLPDPPEYVAEADPLLGAAEAPHAGEPDAPWRIADRSEQ